MSNEEEETMFENEHSLQCDMIRAESDEVYDFVNTRRVVIKS